MPYRTFVRRCVAVALLGPAAFLVPAVGLADAVWLQSGEVVEGTLTETSTLITVNNERGRSVYPRSQVLLTGDSVTHLYQQLAAKVHDRPSHMKLAEWCLENNLQAQALEQLNFCNPRDPAVMRLKEDARNLTPREPPAAAKEPRTPAFDLSPQTAATYRRQIIPLLRNGCGSTR